MTRFSYRCPTGHDFEITAPMGLAPSTATCSAHNQIGQRVFNGCLQFSQGKAVFHDGLEGDGQTNREWAERTAREFRERTGRDAEPVGTRWI